MLSPRLSRVFFIAGELAPDLHKNGVVRSKFKFISGPFLIFRPGMQI